MMRKLIPLLALLAPFGAWAQSSPCPVSTNGASSVYVNDSTTGTTANKVVSLTSAGNAIVYPHAQTVGAIGVAYYGAGAVPNSGVCVQQTGEIPVIADAAVTINHWVTTSTSVDGDIHDTTTACTAAPPSGVEVVGCAVTASSGAGVAALVSLRNFISATGVSQSGTAISGTTCVIIASGTNTVQCGTAADTGTYFQPKETLDMQAQNTAEESTTAGGTYNVGNLACVTGSNTVGDCASAAANQAFIGINLAKNGALPVTAKSGSAATVKSSASVTWTAGDKVCTDATNAALSVDNGTTDCGSPQRQVGIVKTTDGGNTTSHVVDLMFSGTNPPAGGGATVIQNAADCAVTGNTPTNCSGMSFSAAANTAYRGQCYFFGGVNVASNANVVWTTPASPTVSEWSIANQLSTISAMTAAIPFSTSTLGTASTVFFFSFINGSNAGTVQLQVWDGTGGDTATLKAGSYCVVQ